MTEPWDATSYHRISDPQYAWGLRVLERASLRGDEHVLDAGCGTGRLTAELAARVSAGFVVGADLSPDMLVAADATLSRDVAPRGSGSWALVRASLVELPFRGAFDLVFSTATFHWIRDHPALFASVRGALRPGGRLEAQCGGGPNLARLHARARALGATEPFRAHLDDWVDPWEFADAATTERRLRAAGFARVSCWLEARPTSFPGAAAFREFLQTVVLRTFLARLPAPALRESFLDDMTQAAARDDPSFTLDYWRLNISAARD